MPAVVAAHTETLRSIALTNNLRATTEQPMTNVTSNTVTSQVVGLAMWRTARIFRERKGSGDVRGVAYVGGVSDVYTQEQSYRMG